MVTMYEIRKQEEQRRNAPQKNRSQARDKEAFEKVFEKACEDIKEKES